MATQKITTRIKNKIDSLESWVASNPILLNGEIAIIKVATGSTFVNSVTGQTETVYELLMKIGNGTAPFDQLPWLSSKASDVFDWGKLEDPEDIPITILVGSTETNSTLGAWLKSINDKANTNASNISSVSAKVDVAKVSTAITAAIKVALEGLTTANSDITGDGNFVKAVTQTNGKVKITYGNISDSDLPNGISASKISVGNTTLDTKITSIDSDISDLKGRQPGHEDSEINTLITNKINALNFAEPNDSTATTTDTIFIDSVSQVNGKITATKKKLPTATDKVAGIVTLGASGGAATYATVSALSNTVSNHDTDIAAIKSAVTGGVHFIGISSTAITDGGTEKPTINNTAKTPTQGDVVIYNTKEYIWTGSLWKELGDQGRLATLESKIDNLEYTDPDYAAGKVVTKVTQTDGQITVTHDTLSSADVSHDSTTVDAALDDHSSRIAAAEGKLDGVTKVTTSITNAINNLNVSEPTASTSTSTTFIATAKQDKGKIVVTKKTLPTATNQVAGIMKLGATGGAASYDAYTSFANSVNTDLNPKVAAINTTYVRFNSTDSKLYVGSAGTDEIIFDCGGADI